MSDKYKFVFEQLDELLKSLYFEMFQKVTAQSKNRTKCLSKNQVHENMPNENLTNILFNDMKKP